jgi:hypothetical protein
VAPNVINGHIPQPGQHRPDLPPVQAILVEADIPHPVDRVFDAPVLAHQGQHSLRRRGAADRLVTIVTSTRIARERRLLELLPALISRRW